MIINKLENKAFKEFATKIIGVDINLYKEDLRIIRSDNHINLQVYLGGEADDGRSLEFRDFTCFYANNAHGRSNQEISRVWVKFLMNRDELTDEEKAYIVQSYNNRIQSRIEKYASEMLEQQIER